MRILALVQKFDRDDHILGFLHAWLTKIAQRIDGLYIVSLECECAELEKNIKAYSAGKEYGYNKIHIFYKLNKIIAGIILKKKVDLVFVLMCPEYALLVSPYAKIARIPVVMWYAHGHAGMKLRIAHLLVDRVIAPSKKSFRVKSNKLIVTGHGIDVEKFKNQNLGTLIKNEEKIIIISIGRISPVKGYQVLIKAANILINQKNIRDLEFQIAGGVPLESQERYLDYLKDMVREYNLEDYVRFLGPLSYAEIHRYYQGCSFFVSTSNTGSIDKAVLEAMACGKIILTSNEAFKDLLKPYSSTLMFDKNDPESLAEKISYILNMGGKDALACDLREMVESNHSLNRFINNTLAVFKDAIVNR